MRIIQKNRKIRDERDNKILRILDNKSHLAIATTPQKEEPCRQAGPHKKKNSLTSRDTLYASNDIQEQKQTTTA